MDKLSAQQIREIWIDFFKEKNHLFVEPKSLIPVNDPSLLWINSGVATLKDYFSGKSNPPSQRLVNVQKSIRTNDIFNVGVTARHHTFFEMMGNFSIGDYFKPEAIEFAFELLTKRFEIPLSKLYFTIFEDDEIAFNKWVSLGVPPNRIIKGNRDRNFWDVGQGPCGPCTEIYFDRGEKYDPNKLGEKLIFEDIENDRYVEIWNIVFSQFNNDGTNHYTELARKNIDTGAGLERFACIFQDVPTNYDTNEFQSVIRAIGKLTNKQYDMNAYFGNDLTQKLINHDYIVIVDHIKANMFAISDGALPSAKDRGSVLRKLIRRAMVCARRLEIKESFISITVDALIEINKEFYPYLTQTRDKVIKVLQEEEVLFNKTLDNGFELFNKALNSKNFDAKTAFKLTETYGFPYELVEEMMNYHHIKIDKEEYAKMIKTHQEVSKSRKDVKGMMQQNATLLNYKETSTFDYDSTKLNNALVIGLFDEDFNRVNSLNGNGWVVFDNTVFYATSGGQICDTGIITINNNQVKVDDVIKGPNGQHFHHVVNASIKLNDHADLQINEHNRSLVTKNHSTEHLLHKALRTLIDQNINQEGAFKSPEKVTFDFSCDHHLSNDELMKIEDEVNSYIQANKPVCINMLTLEEAKQENAVGHFEDVYKKIGGKLRVVKMQDITTDICGGTHVKNTKDIEKFMITKLFSVGGGLYRIEAITSNETVSKYLDEQINKIQQKINLMNEDLSSKNIKDNQYTKLLSIVSYKNDLAEYHDLVNKFNELNGIYNKLILSYNKQNASNNIRMIKEEYKSMDQSPKILINKFTNLDLKTISSALTELINEDKQHAYVALSLLDTKTQYVCMANKQFCQENNFNAGELVKKLNVITKGSGGGRDTFAQGGCNGTIDFESVLNSIKDQ